VAGDSEVGVLGIVSLVAGVSEAGVLGIVSLVLCILVAGVSVVEVSRVGFFVGVVLSVDCWDND
jgi:hypothetical protein